MRYSQVINRPFLTEIEPSFETCRFYEFLYNGKNLEFSESVGFGQKCQNHPYIDQNRRFAPFEMFSFQMHLKTHQMVRF